ncbi:MAG TPA: hypothetical protein VGQ62_09950, partial [Chloroflexota bacterium]|nr:hypothetical protein [Chloroflexota bacterium]
LATSGAAELKLQPRPKAPHRRERAVTATAAGAATTGTSDAAELTLQPGAERSRAPSRDVLQLTPA